MESNALEKSMKNRILSMLFARTPSRIRWIVRICDVLKAVQIFSKDFLDIGLDTIGMKDILNLSSCGSKNNNSVVLSDFEVAFIGREDGAAVNRVLFILSVADSKKNVVKSPCLLYFRRYFVVACSFSVFNSFSTASMFSSVNCSSLISSK